MTRGRARPDQAGAIRPGAAARRKDDREHDLDRAADGTVVGAAPARRGSILPAGPGLSPDAEDVVAVLADGAVRTLLQPVVDLRTQAVVAHEALLRGPNGHALETPLALLSPVHATRGSPPRSTWLPVGRTSRTRRRRSRRCAANCS